MTDAPAPTANGGATARLATVWLGIAVAVIAAANLWPIDLVPTSALGQRLEEMLRQDFDIGTMRAVLVWAAIGVLAMVAASPVKLVRSRLVAAFAMAAAVLLIEGGQLFAAARHASLLDGLVGAALAAFPILLPIAPPAGLGRLLWALAGLVIAASVAVVPVLGIHAAQRAPFANWSEGFPLSIGAEGDGSRVWEGRVGHVTLYDRAVDDDGLALLSTLPATPVHSETRARLGSVYTYQSDQGAALTALPSPADLVSQVRAAGAITVELTASSTAPNQFGQPRLLTLSPDPYRRNFTIGQEGPHLYVRVRTPWSGTNGIRQGLSLWPNVFATDTERHIAVSYDGAAVRVFVDGTPAGPAQSLYRPRLDLKHDGPAGDLALLVLLCSGCAALAGAFAPGIAGKVTAGALAPGLLVQAGIGLAHGSLWTWGLVGFGILAALLGLWIARRVATLGRGDIHVGEPTP